MSYSAVRGTKDILPEESALWQFVEFTARNIFHQHNFKEIRTPIFESESLFTRVIGDASDIVTKEMYTFTDKGDRPLALRPEGTAPVARAFLSNHLHRGAGDTRLYYMGPMFRYERPQAGRYRQFHQVGLECLGSPHPYTDAEIISLCYRIFSKLGLKNLRININSVGCKNCRAAIRDKVSDFFSAIKDDLSEQQQSTLNTNPLRLLDSKDPKIKAFIAKGFDVQDALCDASNSHHKRVLQYLDELKIPYTENPLLVRGLDYYTDTVFEVISDGLGAQNAVCGGGRYNHLIEDIGGPDTPAFGFAFGIERLILLLEQLEFKAPETLTHVYVATLGDEAQLKAVSIAQMLRSLGFKVSNDYSKSDLNPHLKRASKLKADFALIIGDDEVKNNTVLIKTMKTHQQESVSIHDLATFFNNTSKE